MTIKELLDAKIIKGHKNMSVLKVEDECGNLIAELYINKIYELFYYIVGDCFKIEKILNSKITYIKPIKNYFVIRSDY